MEHGITGGGLFFARLEHTLAAYGVDPIPAIDALIVSVLLIIFAYFSGRKFRGTEMLEPEGRVTLSFFVEFALGGMLTFFESIIQHGARKLFFFARYLRLFHTREQFDRVDPGV